MYHLAANTLITPYNSKECQTGMSYQASVSFDFTEAEVLETLEISLFPGEKQKRYFRLSLGDNPTAFDSYLVLVSDVESDTE